MGQLRALLMACNMKVELTEIREGQILECSA